MNDVLSQIGGSNRGAAKKFDNYLSATDVSLGTRINYAKAFRRIDSIAKPCKEITKDDLIDFFNNLNGQLGDSTKNLYRILIKRVFQWVYYGEEAARGGKYYKVYPEVVRWITPSIKKKKYAKVILSKKHIREMIEACDNQRDRALVFVLYESGARAGEFLGLRIRDVTFDKYGAVLRVNGKTGERRIRIFDSVPDLQLWLEMHPRKDDPEAPLWRSNRDDFLAYPTLQHVVRKYSRAVGLPRDVTPHSFRHSRATHLATILTEAQMKEFFGWEKNSTMPGVYVHLSGRDTDKTLLEAHGIDIDEGKTEEEKNPLNPVPCPRCRTENPPGFRFCGKCSMVLDTKTAVEVEEAEGFLKDVHERQERLSQQALMHEIQKLREEVQALKEQG